MLVLLLLTYLVFIKPVLAAPSVVINSTPDIITAGTTFPISFTITEASSSASYYYKFFGGIDNDVYKITNDSDLSYSSPWSNFPQITLDQSSSNVFNSYAFIKSDATTGTFNLKVRLAFKNSNGDFKSSSTSPTFPIEVIAAPPPTSTPTPTDPPTPTPTKTTTPTPTKTPPTPTKISTPTPTPIETETPAETIFNSTSTSTPSPIPEVLGVSDTQKTKRKFLPLIFICIGGLFLLTPLIIAKIKHGSQKDN